MIRLLTLTFLLTTAAFSQAPRILIVTDMEGVGGVNDRDEQVLPGQRRFDESRHILAGEVNAAVEGAIQAGASEVVIWDGHDGSRSLSVDDIHPKARLIQGKPTPSTYYMSEKRFDGIMFVGQHAMAGTKNAIMAHTQSFAMKRVTINGKPVGEMGQVAAIGGYFGIPVIMLSGDEAACAEMRDFQPKAFTVAVKRLAGKASSWSLSHVEAKRQIQEAARGAVASVRQYKPWKIDGPVEMVFEYLPQLPQHPEPRTATYKGNNMLEAFEAWLGKLD